VELHSYTPYTLSGLGKGKRNLYLNSWNNILVKLMEAKVFKKDMNSGKV
jgi:hypothetical protein